MTIKFMVPVILGLSLLASVGSAQTIAEQMQKAIYAQETAGDLDAAIQIYRRILGSAPSRQYAAQAQFRLAEALLQKGDLQSAAYEFLNLSQSYPESKEMIASMAAHMRSGHAAQEYGIMQGGRYHNFLTNVELTVPDGWLWRGDSPSSDDGQMAMMDSSSRIPVLVWMRPELVETSELALHLHQDLEEKPSQRTGFEGWKIRPESIQQRTVTGWPGLRAIADYVENGKPMVEYLFWVYSGKTHIQFFGRAEAQQLPALQTDVEKIANSALIP